MEAQIHGCTLNGFKASQGSLKPSTFKTNFMTQGGSVIITNKGAEVAVCCMRWSCDCILLDKSESLARQRAWQPSESSSWLPSQSALPTGRRLARRCHFSTAPTVVTGDGRVGKRRGRSAGCQMTPVSAAP